MSLRAGLVAFALCVLVAGCSGTVAPSQQPPPATPPTPTDTPRPSPTPAVTSSPAPTVAPTMSSTSVSFTSPLYGYTVRQPDNWAVTPATAPWALGRDLGHNPTYHDWFEGPSAYEDFGGVLVAAQRVPAGMTPDQWIREYAESQAASGRDCKGPADDWFDVVVGSLTISRIDLECFETRVTDVAFVVDGGAFVMSGNPVVIDLFLDSFDWQ